MPTILNDTNLFLWLDLDQPTPEEARQILETTFHFHPLEIEDCLAADSSPKVEEYAPREEDKFASHLFIVVHAVDYNRKDGAFATSELNLFLGKNFLVTAHAVPLKSVNQILESAGPDRAPVAGRVGGSLQAGHGRAGAGDWRVGRTGAGAAFA